MDNKVIYFGEWNTKGIGLMPFFVACITTCLKVSCFHPAQRSANDFKIVKSAILWSLGSL